jgi:hypothetical protein
LLAMMMPMIATSATHREQITRVLVSVIVVGS